MRRENSSKDDDKRQLQDELEAERALYKKERQETTDNYEKQIKELKSALNERDTQLKTMQQELVDIKDFRKKRQEMIKDLEIQKAEVLDLERRHKESITRMEKKFFEEKIRLQKDANRKISELAMRAHKEAVANLDETTKSVYRENMRMVEALHHHVLLGEDLERQNKDLAEMNKRLVDEKETHDIIIKEKIVQNKYHNMEIKTLQEKILSMEHSLTHIVQEFEREREVLAHDTKRELEDIKQVAKVLRESLNKKASEVKYVKVRRSTLEEVLFDV